MSLRHKPLAYGMRKPELKKVAQANPSLSQKDVEKIITKILEEVRVRVVKDLRTWIKKFVPKMTGRLRFDLYSHVKDSAVKNNILRIHLQTSVAYAKYVNRYKTSQVRHKGKKVKYRGRTIVLHDPLAIGGFFDKMVIFTIKIILYYLVKIKRKYSAKTRLKYAEMKIIKLW